ncbi:PREDICTED: dual oxidase maturation factor 1-like [Priapulus caudatus]|uniref:Dual oxidase maturation factor 1-like n=1 Tax=Priapulus caudatus TaxID=37621 RepID=A0ABM1DU42_PRICU|nr:PREDICTED: dual oxidase maturation factor 1-like [Priapulus caudatus]XP_014663464.1 PREDICTED: dual oxidase maturation factor 1-like [Priapulus caudatus]
MAGKIYQAYRNFGYPTMYGENLNPVTADVLIAGFIFATAIVAFSFVIVLPGVRGKERWTLLIRGTFSIVLGAIIMITNYGQEWEVGDLHLHVPYKAFTPTEVDAELGVKIGLRSVNITMKAPNDNELNETINYNERFTFGWQQGRLGFGPSASQFNREFRVAQFTGLPLPILWIAEYFTLDGEGIRWGRHYRQAGFYAHVLMWLAFPFWILSNILFFMVIRYGALLLGMTGGCMVLANILYAAIRNYNELVIPFGGDAAITFHWGWSFWLALIAGIVSVLVAAVIYFMDLRFPEAIHAFFGVDILQDYEEYYADTEEVDQNKEPNGLTEPVASGSRDQLTIHEEGADVEGNEPQVVSSAPIMRRRAGTRFQKSLIKKPKVSPRARQDAGSTLAPQHANSTVPDTEDMPLYENISRDNEGQGNTGYGATEMKVMG